MSDSYSQYSQWILLVIISVVNGCLEPSTPMSDPVINQPDGMAMSDATVDIDQSVEAMMDMAVLDQLTREDDALVDARPMVDPPLVPSAVVVKLGSESTIAGVDNQLSCLVYAQNGQTIPLDPSWGNPRFDLRPLTGWRWSDEDAGDAVGERADIYEARCQFPSLGLRSEPKNWAVLPAAPDRLITHLEGAEAGDLLFIDAGDPVIAQCHAFDRYENSVELLDVEWNVEPMTELEQDQDFLTFAPTLAGEYQISCFSPEAMGAQSSPASMVVFPGLPASIEMSFETGRSVYSVGDVVEIATEVRDRFDNPIEAVPLSITSVPPLPRFGVSRFEGARSGNYTARSEVVGPTFAGLPLSASKTFMIEDGAPAIRCESPYLGENTPRGTIAVTGEVTDLGEISSFKVNGVETPLNAQGEFSKNILPSWGLNVVELIAEDSFGNQSIERCFFFASSVYLPELSRIDDVALLHLSQDAIDDGAPYSPITSLGDLLGGMINSQELVDTVDDVLEAQNPIYPENCLWSLFGCRFSIGATYNSTTVGGPNSTALTLVNGGLAVDATIRDLTIGLTAFGVVLGPRWSQAGTVNLSSARIQATLDVSLAGGQPQLTLRADPQVTLGSITLNLQLNLAGVGSYINRALNFVLGAFEGVIRDQVAGALEDYLAAEVDSILSSALSSLDLNALGLSVSLPRPLGGSPYQLGVNLTLNRFEASSSRLMIGMRSQVTGQRSQAISSTGIASPIGSRYTNLWPGNGQDASGGAHVTLLNSILHRLWRGEYFNIDFVPDEIGGGVNLEMELLVPPVIELSSSGSEATLHFGPALAHITAEALFDEPITLNLAGFASTEITIDDNAVLSFSPISVDEIFFSSPGFRLSVAASEALEGVVIDVMQSVLDQALNFAIPSFPIPDFALPASLSAYGIPIGTRLGVRDLVLSQDGRRLVVKGDLR